ncbi:glycosyltransferase [Amycolatopsis solani]|uniref:glycosyltransferase n=1 Tax=Amycolatopsis solani TaxID=3028615 RepID=UPI00297001D7|nr:glycosyltransferase [Amycolatopsis sp. MEP2-6]
MREPGPGPRLVHVNATATGGGVAELLHGLVPAQLASGVDAGWAVIAGDDSFFAFTKSLHHLLHDRGAPRISAADLDHYRAVLAPQAAWLAARVGPGDTVVLHDPQVLGLAPALSAAGARVVWHCHIGTDAPGAAGPEVVWRAFAAELSTVDVVVTALAAYAPPGRPVAVCAPAFDPKAAKNRPMSAAEANGLLAEAGLTAEGASELAVAEQDGPMPAGARMVLQVSRWDPLKDMPGVLRLLPGLPGDVHLVLAGNDPEEIPDDPEGLAVLAEVRRLRAELPASLRRRVHLVRTSQRDPERAALLINALQRRADVVVQKSLAEGFGLTVTEAMAKGRPVVAGRVGGLCAQIEHGRTGLLVDPADTAAVADAVNGLLSCLRERERIGAAAAEAAAATYPMDRLVADYRAVAARIPEGAAR